MHLHRPRCIVLFKGALSKQVGKSQWSAQLILAAAGRRVEPSIARKGDRRASEIHLDNISFAKTQTGLACVNIFHLCCSFGWLLHCVTSFSRARHPPRIDVRGISF
jgi:hypothetical protein